MTSRVPVRSQAPELLLLCCVVPRISLHRAEFVFFGPFCVYRVFSYIGSCLLLPPVPYSSRKPLDVSVERDSFTGVFLSEEQ